MVDAHEWELLLRLFYSYDKDSLFYSSCIPCLFSLIYGEKKIAGSLFAAHLFRSMKLGKIVWTYVQLGQWNCIPCLIGKRHYHVFSSSYMILKVRFLLRMLAWLQDEWFPLISISSLLFGLNEYYESLPIILWGTATIVLSSRDV